MRRLKVLPVVFLLMFALETWPDRANGSEEHASKVRGSPRQSLAIVVNRSNPIDDLPFNELRKIFLGERRHWQVAVESLC